jgi:hypothetical protein
MTEQLTVVVHLRALNGHVEEKISIGPDRAHTR